MKNATPRSPRDLFSACEKAADGLHLHESDIGIMHNTESVTRADLASARTAEGEYQAAKAAKPAATDAQASADAEAIKYIVAARDVLKNHLGARYSQAWNAAGFINGSLEVPGTISQRMELLKSLQAYFGAHPTYEVASLNVTGTRARDIHETLSDGASGVNSA
ncbi:MAG: hypothetical protein EPO07_07305, partial [Verrucomicrobia bacterium]